MTTCGGKGEPVQGCPCFFCRSVRPVPEPVQVKERISFPSGDFTEDDE